MADPHALAVDDIIQAVVANLWQEALRRTRRGPLGQLAGLFGADALDDSFWEELEAALIGADLGVAATGGILEELRARSREEGWQTGADARKALQAALQVRLKSDPVEELNGQPHMILLVGVNGSGKTTTAARLAYRWQQRGASVMLAAADTFRAAAAEQLDRWADRLGAPLIRGEPGSDPGAVVYNAGQTASSGGADVVVADTSGRMHTSHNLMAELQKIHRVAGKVVEGGPQETLLVLDATTGQNGLSQARAFVDAIPISGVVLAKLDSSARGGVALAICQQLGLPLRYVGLGEGIGDLAPFDPDRFVAGLLAEAPAGGQSVRPG